MAQLQAPRSGTQGSRPFLRWAGGKSWLAPKLAKEIADWGPLHYYEPFLGAGAVLLELLRYFGPHAGAIRAHGTDINAALINAWNIAGATPASLTGAIQSLADVFGDDQAGYLKVRERFNQTPSHQGLGDAAQFVYLNALCFNGLWRENNKGGFNVPYGKRRREHLPTHFADISDRMNTAGWMTFGVSDFADAIQRARKTQQQSRELCAIYADPPYYNTFTKYTAKDFGFEQQSSLAQELKKAADVGVRVWATNSDTPEIRTLYHWANLEVIEEPRRIAANGDRGRATCLLIRSHMRS